MQRSGANILFVMLSGKGHLNPSFGVARRLVERGHRVCYAGARDAEEYTRAQGFEFVLLSEHPLVESFMGRPEERAKEPTLGGAPIPLQSYLEFFKGEMELLIRKVRPEMFVMDCLLPNVELIIQLLKAYGLPHLLVSPFLLANSKYNFPSNRERVMVLCPPEFNFPQSQVKAEHQHVEASIDLMRLSPAFPWESLRVESRLIYCSLGTESYILSPGTRRAFYLNVMEAAVQRPDWQWVVSLGVNPAEYEFESVPPNVLLFQQVPQLDFLKRASLMLTHGGLGTIKECIYFGVPMIVFAMDRDQPANAARVAYHNLGISANIETTSGADLLAMIARLDENPVYRTGVARMKEIFRRHEEAGRSVQIIEGLLDAAAARPSAVSERAAPRVNTTTPTAE